MTDVSITPEDRERLAKTKFKEWADEWFKEVGPAAFNAWLEEVRKTAGGGQQQQQQQQQGNQPNQQQQQPQPQRRRSLLDIALSDTFGF